MTREERFAIIRAGVSALHAQEAERRAELPPPDRDDPVVLRELRDLSSLVERLESALELSGADEESRTMCDAVLSTEVGPDDAALIRALAADRGAGTPYRMGPPPQERAAALAAMAVVLDQYLSQEFVPPAAWFRSSIDEAD